MSALHALALALRQVRGSAATDAAGHDDAEDADVVLSALRAAGWEVVPAAMLRERLAAREFTMLVLSGLKHGSVTARSVIDMTADGPEAPVRTLAEMARAALADQAGEAGK